MLGDVYSISNPLTSTVRADSVLFGFKPVQMHCSPSSISSCVTVSWSRQQLDKFPCGPGITCGLVSTCWVEMARCVTVHLQHKWELTLFYWDVEEFYQKIRIASYFVRMFGSSACSSWPLGFGP